MAEFGTRAPLPLSTWRIPIKNIIMNAHFALTDAVKFGLILAGSYWLEHDLMKNPGNSHSKRLCFLTQRLECLRKNFACYGDYDRVVRKVKISDLAVPNDTS